MKFTDEQIDSLRREVGGRLSPKRFAHTLGVEKMAVRLGEICLPGMIDKLQVAALLHDISKEYSEAEYFLTIKKHNLTLTEEDLAKKNEAELIVAKNRHGPLETVPLHWNGAFTLFSNAEKTRNEP